MDDVHVININELVVAIAKEQDSDRSSSRTGTEETTRPLIHRINPHISDKPKNAFFPHLLSIGPYNYGISATLAMQKTKYSFINYIVNLNHEKGLLDYLAAMRQLEKEVRSCYVDEILMEKTDFPKMLLLDGCFILVSLNGVKQFELELNKPDEVDADLDENDSRVAKCEGGAQVEAKQQNTQFNATNEVDDRVYSSPTDILYSQYCWHDMLLLENQIPFFVIKTIHNLMTGGSDETSLVENVMQSVECELGSYPKAICESNRPRNFHHLLHLCHMYFKPCWAETQIDRYQMQLPSVRSLHQLRRTPLDGINQISFNEGLPWRQATEYIQAGIGFKKRSFRSENPHSLLDIVFCNGVIEIPCLTVEPNTYSLFCNLIAFEQTCPQFGSFVTTYIMFLSCLISMPEDASLLTEKGIIVHQLNSDAEVSDLFLTISECIVSGFDNDSYLKSLCHRIEGHYQSQRHVLREFLGSITSVFSKWTQKSELSDLPTSIPTRTSP